MSNRFDQLRQRNSAAMSDSRTIAKNTEKIVKEEKRVASIAGNIHVILEDLDKQFEEATKLNKTDIAFLMFATALQCVRQYVLTPFKERLGDKETADPVHKQEKEVNKILFSEYESQGKANWYYAPMNDIITKPGVPYDAITGSSSFGIGLSGNTHRFKTLGHDPLLGWVFGTANIMTNTLTTNEFASYHVKPGYIISNHASTGKILSKAYQRAFDEPVALAAAVVKEGFHLKSDEYSKVGLPIPGISAMVSAEAAQSMAKRGLDIGNVKIIGKQALEAAFINYLIALVHMLFYDETIYASKNLYEVKTRKILSYSNIIAVSSNVIITAMAAITGTATGNAGLVKSSLRYLDIGGIIVAIYRLVNDKKFIMQVQKEFLEKELYNMVMGTNEI